VLPTPSPAKTAVKKRMVMGLVRVRKNVDRYAFQRLFLSTKAPCSAGLERIVNLLHGSPSLLP